MPGARLRRGHRKRLDRRDGQQAGTDRMGGTRNWPGLPSGSRTSCCVGKPPFKPLGQLSAKRRQHRIRERPKTFERNCQLLPAAVPSTETQTGSPDTCPEKHTKVNLGDVQRNSKENLKS